MTNYTATCYGVSGDNKYTQRGTSALGKTPDPNKGQTCVRVAIAAGSQIMGGEVWVNAGTVLANADTLTLTVTTTTGRIDDASYEL